MSPVPALVAERALATPTAGVTRAPLSPGSDPSDPCHLIAQLHALASALSSHMGAVGTDSSWVHLDAALRDLHSAVASLHEVAWPDAPGRIG